jgi:hypothetical protein
MLSVRRYACKIEDKVLPLYPDNQQDTF